MAAIDYASINHATITNHNNNPCMPSQQPHPVYASYSVTPIVNRRSLFATKIEKAVQTIKNNYNTQNSSSTTNSSSSSTNTNQSNGIVNPNNSNVFCLLWGVLTQIINPKAD
jgi:hypothetical protein